LLDHCQRPSPWQSLTRSLYRFGSRNTRIAREYTPFHKTVCDALRKHLISCKMMVLLGFGVLRSRVETSLCNHEVAGSIPVVSIQALSR
jgi:hypothetical protein